MPATLLNHTPKTDLEFYWSDGFDVSHYKGGVVTTVECFTSTSSGTAQALGGCCLGDGRVLVQSYCISTLSMAYVFPADLSGGLVEWGRADHSIWNRWQDSAGNWYEVDAPEYGPGIVYDPTSNTVWIATNYWPLVSKDGGFTSGWPYVYTVGQWSVEGKLLKVAAAADDGANTGIDRWVSQHGGNTNGCTIDVQGRKIYWIGEQSNQFSLTCYDIAADQAIGYIGAFEQIHTDAVGIDGAMHISFNPVSQRLVGTEGIYYGNGEYSYHVSYEVNNNPNLDSAWYEQIRDSWIISDSNYTGTEGPYSQGGYSSRGPHCLVITADGNGAIYDGIGKQSTSISDWISGGFNGNITGFFYVHYPTDTIQPIPLPSLYYNTYASGDFQDVWLPASSVIPPLRMRQRNDWYGIDTGHARMAGNLEANQPTSWQQAKGRLKEGQSYV